MKPLKTLNLNNYDFKITKTKKGRFCEDIFTFDTETSSLFVTPDGDTIPFDTSKPKTFWEKCKPFGLCYIWMLSVCGDVYYSRRVNEISDTLCGIDNALNGAKYKLWVHNLGFDFQVIRSFLQVQDMFVRKTHKPYRIQLADCSCVLEDSYVLAMMSLDKVAENYTLPHSKQVGKLDYNLIRTPSTPLSDDELKYCEYDCLVLHDYIRYKLLKYGSVWDIPMTQTGEVREELKANIIGDDNSYYAMRRWKNRIAKMHPDWDSYKMMLQAYAGGYTHANAKYYGQVLSDVQSFDFTSSYPAVMIMEQFPMTKSFRADLNRINLFKLNIDKYAYLLDITVKDLKESFYNHFISKSKCYDIDVNAITDNGRVVEASYLSIVVTELDWIVMQKCYDIKPSQVVLNECRIMYKHRLPKEIANLVYTFYKNKSQYKHVPEKKAFYNYCKQMLNGIYGMTVTKYICDAIEYDDINGWSTEVLTEEECISKLSELDGNELLPYCVGVWVSAYARYNLWQGILANDKYVVYCDTDSIKLVPGFNKQWFDDYNSRVHKKITDSANYYGLDANDLYPLGEWDDDGLYSEFVTLGAKRYACRYDAVYAAKHNEDTDLHITVSGVAKSGASALDDDIYNFENGFIFDTAHCGKKIVHYLDCQEPTVVTDYYGNKEVVNQKTGICLEPTSYAMNVDDDYLTQDCGSEYILSI